MGCSSSGSPAPTDQPSVGGPTTAAAGGVEDYLAAINALCDALLPKIIKVTHGGRIDVPVHQFLATWPAHDRLHKQFDADVAAVAVPPDARGAAARLAAYVRFANRLDAARLTAAHHGEAAWRKEVQAESGAANDPAITKLEAAGFNQSCTSR